MDVGQNEQLKVYIRLPIPIKEELQIKDLHPDIQTVILPRQKSRRWCFIVFPNPDARKKVIAHLRTIKIKNKKIIIKTAKKRKPKSKPVEVLLSTDKIREAAKDRLELLLEENKN